MQDSCFFYSMQVDNENRLTNILWADDKSMMFIRFAQVDNENRLTNIFYRVTLNILCIFW